MRIRSILLSAVVWSAICVPQVPACTNFLITRGASADGSTMITYSADSHELYGDISHYPAAVYQDGAWVDIIEWETGKFLGRIPQAKQTYAVVGLMNEHQVAIGETTYGGREELAKGPSGIVDYVNLMIIALQRGKTAREAIQVMGAIVAEHGYASEGESFSISDPNEVWLMDLIGKGKGEKGAVWVARRIPDGYISAHANQARIRQFPLKDPDNCLYSPDVITFARGKRWFDGRDEDFSFMDTYSPPNFSALRFCEARVWCMFNRAAPSLKLPTAYIMGDIKAEPLPLWIKPDKKLSVHDVMQLMRDHFEGTPLDMTQDVGAGPFVLPYRWRPMEWKVGEKTYVHERAVSTQQTGYSFVTQSRSWLPGPIGGIFWFGVDDTFTTVYMPMYCGIQALPKPFAKGTANFGVFTWDSGFWVFNFVANWAYTRYMDMIQDIQPVQREMEGKFLAETPEIEKMALDLFKRSPQTARDYLTAYSVKQGDETYARWKKLGEFLLWKYLDGNMRDSQGKVTHPRYPDAWYERIIKETGDRYVEPPQKEKN